VIVPALAAAPTATATPDAVPAKPSASADPLKPPAPAAAAQPSARNTPGVAVTRNSLPPAGPINPKGTPGVIALLQTTDGSERDPMSWAVRVYKSQHKLDVFYKGRLYRSYRAVFGRNLDTSAKVFAGDRRTPEGNYLIISKYPSRRWRWFLKLNYPNTIDLTRYEELRAAHEIPVKANAGGSIGIHGTDLPMLNEGNINWTTGCISLDNGAVDELEALLPVGTLVVIRR
jgi:lipoprotein-anchoring transpeptidase ErfK/SrfK